MVPQLAEMFAQPVSLQAASTAECGNCRDSDDFPGCFFKQDIALNWQMYVFGEYQVLMPFSLKILVLQLVYAP